MMAREKKAGSSSQPVLLQKRKQSESSSLQMTSSLKSSKLVCKMKYTEEPLPEIPEDAEGEAAAKGEPNKREQKADEKKTRVLRAAGSLAKPK